METSLLGSPRSSSGYGSCEEDQRLMGLRGGCFGSSGNRQRRISYTAMSCSTGSAPLTPDSSPSEPPSCLNSPDPFSLDFQSVFQQDDVLPDWTNTDDPFDSWSQQRQSELFEPFEAKYESLELSPIVKVEPAEVVSEDELLVPSPPPERHILVSLLKRPKAELDWITTGETTTQTSSSSSSLSSKQKYLKSAASNSTTTTESAMPSPLQRLKALTNSNVVNHVQLTTTTTTTTTSSAALSSRIINSANQPHSMYPIATMNSLQPAVPSSSSSSSSSSRPVYQKPTVIVSTTSRQKSARSVSCAAAARSTHKSPTPSSSSLLVRQQSSRLAADKRQSFAAAGCRTISSSGGVRRLRTELDDHRYSSLQLPPSSSSSSSSSSSLLSVSPGRPPTKTQRLNNNNAARTVASQYHQQQQPASFSASSSILETLLLTSEPLRPNEGSEASLAACGVSLCDAVCVKTEPPGDEHSSILEHLLTGNNTFTQQQQQHDDDDDDDQLSVAATTTDNYALFSEHLLFDSHGLGLFTDDDTPAPWTPSCLDDSRVMSCELEEVMQQQADEGHNGSQDDTWLQQYLTDLL